VSNLGNVGLAKRQLLVEDVTSRLQPDSRWRPHLDAIIVLVLLAP
jgi:hypothetical protein